MVLLEIWENIAYVIVGGLVAVGAGAWVQHRHIEKERKNDIKKVRELLVPEFKELYHILMEERKNIKGAKRKAEKDFDSLINGEMDMDDYLNKTGGLRLKSLVWDTIISSGNLIKLDNKEIEIIQSVQQSVRLYNKDLDRLQKDVGLQLEETLEGVQIPKHPQSPRYGH